MNKNPAANNRTVANWLFACCAAIAIMVILGGLTRLTSSGLSIVKWEPLSGALPPLSKESWQKYFEAYKLIPQYQQMNKGMTLSEFQGIFWLEYFHRLFARAVGVIFLLPFLYFLARGQIQKKSTAKLLGIFALGALQGFAGWYMVSSGLAKRTEVSQYRLAVHLGLAFLIYAMIYWTALDIKYDSVVTWKLCPLSKYAVFVTFLIFIMVLLGALMAGTKAGYTYNTFPLMDGKLIPTGMYLIKPWWINHFENVATIQFQHRVFAFLIAATIFVLAYNIVKRDFDNVGLAIGLTFCVVIQIILGVSTLIMFGTYASYEKEGLAYTQIFNPPILIAAMHQLNALVLFTVALRITHKLAKRSKAERATYVI